MFSDPVHGFVSVPRHLLLDLIQTPEVQRLRRIRQLGVGHLVFPGAEHTRFGHALGAMALMQDTLAVLREKGTPISPDEQTAALAAALLHDIGHGPFSHSLEHELIADFHHEQMSRALLLRLNDRFGGALERALRIFDGTYERPFFHQLVSSQLDMDRLDYLRRDSFYTGVVEGTVGVQRIIKTMRVHPFQGGPDARVVIETKGMYAVENFLIARRLMYLQVYLHKTVLAGDKILQSIFRRARARLVDAPETLTASGSPALLFFLRQSLAARDLDRADVCDAFCRLDDTDVLFSLKQWMAGDDRILADLCGRFVHRNFFRVRFLPQPPSPEQIERWRDQVRTWLLATGLASPRHADADVDLYFASALSRHATYERMTDGIDLIDRDGRLLELTKSEDTAAISTLAGSVARPYVCYPKEVDLSSVPA